MTYMAMDLAQYAFPSEEDDADIVARLGLEQPLTTITFKAPQLLAYHYGLQGGHDRFILSFDKGMGKTITYLAILYATGAKKVVIVCSENAKLTQRREIIRHFPAWKNRWVFVEGNKDARRKAWNSDNSVYICTYDTLAADMGTRAKSTGKICPTWVNAESTPMAFDEWHKKLRNKSSAIFKLLKDEFQNKYMVFSSGSAGGKGPHSQWAVLRLCNKAKFSAYWPYVQKHCSIQDTYFGKKIEGCKDVPKWRREVSSNIFHRRKDAKDYPTKTRQSLEVRMEPWQKKAHDELKNNLLLELPDGEYFASPNVLAMTMKLRQFLVCPKIISPEYGYGAGLEAILADAQDSELSHFVVSTPFRVTMPYISQFFADNKVPCYQLVGGTSVHELEAIIAKWTKTGGVIAQTIQFAESYELPAARVMYMLGYMHSHEQNGQAEDRIHRDIRVTPHPVDIYYIKHLFSYDEQIVEAMSGEADAVHNLMHKPLKEFLV